MSAYMTLLTPMIDRECLLGALSDLGFGLTKVEIHDSPVQLVGYEGRQRGYSANVVIRREHVGRASNDIGFLSTSTGYKAFISDFDQSAYGPVWLKRLNDHYQSRFKEKQEKLAAEERQRLEEQRIRLVEAQRQAVHERAKKLGYRVQESREGETLRLVLVKRTY